MQRSNCKHTVYTEAVSSGDICGVGSLERTQRKIRMLHAQGANINTASQKYKYTSEHS